MSTIALTPHRPTLPARLGTAFWDTLDVTVRNLRTVLRTPQALIFATVQPVIFVLLFRYAFGGAIHVPSVDYVDYLMPGIFAQAVAFGAIGTAVGLSTDLRSGILTRLRALPMARVAVLAGRTLADLARNLLVVFVMTGVGFAVGFRSPHGALPVLAALGLVVAFGYALSWLFVCLGLAIADPEAVQAAGVPIMFLLVFSSSAFVPLDTWRIRTMTIVVRARLAWRSPPRLSRCRSMRPELAEIGAAAHRCAKDASEVSRSGLSPAVTSSWPAVSVPTPGSAINRGAAALTSGPSSASASAISVVSCCQRRAGRRSATRTATCGSVTSVPGRVAARRATSLAVVRFRSGSRTAAGAVTISPRIWLTVCVRVLTALARTTRSARIASTMPSRVFGVPAARPDRTAVAAA